MQATSVTAESLIAVARMARPVKSQMTARLRLNAASQGIASPPTHRPTASVIAATTAALRSSGVKARRMMQPSSRVETITCQL